MKVSTSLMGARSRWRTEDDESNLSDECSNPGPGPGPGADLMACEPDGGLVREARRVSFPQMMGLPMMM